MKRHLENLFFIVTEAILHQFQFRHHPNNQIGILYFIPGSERTEVRVKK